MKQAYYGLLLLLLSCMLMGCEEEEKLPALPKPGDDKILKEVFNVTFWFSEFGNLKAKLETGKVTEKNDGKPENPQIYHYLTNGVTIHFYDATGKPETRITCKEGRLNKADNMAELNGNVVVTRLSDNAMLRTEQLFWEEKKSKLYSLVHTSIQEPDRDLEGEYFESNTSFTRFQLSKAKGEMKVNQL
ncbi:MAG: LPS export ABC transporter periplasmic protein LptC [Bacteroidia bacterium]